MKIIKFFKFIFKFLGRLLCNHRWGYGACFCEYDYNIPDAPGRPCNEYQICSKCGKSKCIPSLDEGLEKPICDGRHNN